MKPLPLPAALLALALLPQCRHAEPTPADPAAQLPPATQTGAHTFGCLLNGQPWTPTTGSANNNYKLTYDPNYSGGALQVKTFYYTGKNGAFQTISFGASNISTTGTYAFSGNNSNTVSYWDTNQLQPCNIYDGSRVFQRGQLVITRLDQVAGIVSGTFAFKLWQPGCDTVRVTAGRFDYKL